MHISPGFWVLILRMFEGVPSHDAKSAAMLLNSSGVASLASAIDAAGATCDSFQVSWLKYRRKRRRDIAADLALAASRAS